MRTITEYEYHESYLAGSLMMGALSAARDALYSASPPRHGLFIREPYQPFHPLNQLLLLSSINNELILTRLPLKQKHGSTFTSRRPREEG